MVVQLKKKLITLILMIIILFALLAGAPFTVQASSPFAGGDGSAAAPFLIETAEQLDAIRHNMSAHYKLNADIDLSGRSWAPIGGTNNVFAGVLDGAGYKIIGLTIHTTASGVGLFSETNTSAILKNISLVDVDIYGDYIVGAMVGRNRGSVENSFASGRVSGGSQIGGLIGSNRGEIVHSCADVAVHSNGAAGGLVGESLGASIKYSCAMGNVTSVGGRVGGLIGDHGSFGLSVGVVQNSYATGNVSGTLYVGGLIGFADAEFVLNSYATGTVTGNEGVGGLVGGILGADVINSYAVGKVTGIDDPFETGGLVGQWNNGSVDNSYYDTNTTGQSDKHKGTAKTTEQMKQRDTFVAADWDFDEVWEIDPLYNDGYPYLQNIQAFITYDGNGHTEGTAPFDGTSYKPGDLVVAMENVGGLKRTGYTFDGWNTQSDGQGTNYAVNETFNAREVNVLFAKWLGNPYTVYYDPQGGTVEPTSQQKRYGSTYGKGLDGLSQPLPIPSREGYSFMGWYSDPDGQGNRVTDEAIVSTMENHTLYAHWILSTFNIIFDSMGGSEVDSQTVEHGNKATEPEPPERTGYTFVGWFEDAALTAAFHFDTPITGNTILHAKWTINQYTVSYEGNGSDGGNVPESVIQDYDTDVTVSGNTGDLAKTGHTFAGWNTEVDGSGTSYQEGETFKLGADDITLYAQWNINPYTVTYDGNGNDGGNEPESVIQDYDTDVTVSGNTGDLTKTGHTFTGWNTEANGSGTSYQAGETFKLGAHDVTLYAQWEKNSYTVSFESNGGTSVDSQTVLFEEKATEPTAPNRIGHIFDGWYSDIALTTLFDFDTPITADTTLYAKWQINSYTISFESNGGTAVNHQTANHGDTATEPNEPTRPGYVFDGWHTDMDLTVPFDFSTPIIGDLTLYAKWRLPEQVAKPKATPSGGPVLSGTHVVLSTTTVSAAVYYTTDETEPSVYSIKYAGPIEVTHDMTIKAIAVKEGMLDSDVLIEHYTIATLPAPVSLTATPSDRSVILNWHAIENKSSVTYAVYQVEGASAPVDPANWELVQAHITANTFTVTGLTNGKTYAFAVKAIYAEGESDFSNVATATPKARDDGGGSGDDGGTGGSPGGGGHGGSGGGSAGDSGMILSTTGVITIPIGRSGEVRLDDEIIIKVSSGAAEQELHITIENLRDTSGLLTDHETLVSHIFEVLKNVSDHFKKPVTLSIKFDPSKVGKDQKAAIFYYDEEDKRWVEVGGEIEGDRITAEIDHFTKFAVLAVDVNEEDVEVTPKQSEVTFTDIAGHWGERSIIAAASQRLVSGYPDGTFKPNNPITRAEFTVMLVNALRMDGAVTTLAFTDQDKIGSWAKHAIALAVQHDIINGYGDGSFRPDVFITRAEMSVMIARALEVTMDVNAQTGFADDEDIPHWAKGAVEEIRQLGIISGRGDNQFVPNETATRAEAVVMLLRMLENKDI